MNCASCQSSNQREFSAELCIHVEHADDAGILIFPRVLVCMDCGLVRFVLTMNELGQLREKRAA
jgi:hypothetical protein